MTTSIRLQIITRSLYQRKGEKSRLVRCFFHHGDDFAGFTANGFVILPAVGTQAAGAVFDPVFCICKVAAAAVCQAVQGAIAEQAAESLRICTCMTGKIFAFLILKKIIM